MEKFKKYMIFILLFIIIIVTGILYHETVRFVFLPVSNKVIVIDAGHGGTDPGKVGKGGIEEDELNLKIAKKLKSLIEQSGGIAIMIREEDVGLYSDGNKSFNEKKVEDLKNRVKIANESDADIFVSIHLNSFPQPIYWGAQTFYKEGSEEGKKLAELIQNELIKVLNPENTRQALSSKNYYLLNNVKIPASVIVEGGFLSNEMEARLLQDDVYQEKIAWAIFIGIMRYIDESSR